MKKTNQTGSIKRRVIAIVLSAITVASFGSATLFSASAAASNTTISAAVNMKTSRAMAKKAAKFDPGKTAYAVITSGLDTVVSKIAETNIFAGIIVNGLFGGFKAIYEAEEEEPSTQDILDKLQELSNQIEANHEKELTELNRGFLNQSIDGYLDSYRVLKGANKRVLAALSEIKDPDNCSDVLCSKIKSMTNEYSDFNAAFDKMSSYLSPDSTSEKSLLDKYMDYMKTKTTDSLVIKENAEQFANLVVGQYILAYAMKLTGYSAEVKKVQIENEIKPTDSKEEQIKKRRNIDDIINSDKGIIRSLTVTDIKSAVDSFMEFKNSLNSIDSATVTIDGEESHYYSIVDAWAAAINGSGEVKIKLNQDIKSDDFANITHITTGTSQYIKNGALYLNNSDSKITLDLNGHALVKKSGEAVVINNCKSFKIISSASSKGEISGIRAEGSEDNKSEIELNNLEFSGGIDTGVYVDESVLNLKINKCTFSNYNDSAVKLDNNYIKEQRNATINNCVFENNTGTKGGAVYNHAFLLDVNNSTLKNNKATDVGGAIYYMAEVYVPVGSSSFFLTIGKIELTNDKLEGNSAKEGGALYVDRENTYGKVNNCTFTNNNADKNGGAICGKYNPKVKNCTFSGNHAGGDGGAFCLKNDTATFYNTKFYNNSCGADGGAISVFAHVDADLNRCEIMNNTCGGCGGGIYFGALSGACTQHQLNNVTISNNTCGNEGGGIYCNTQTAAAGDVNLYNVVKIMNNHRTNGTNSNARMIYAAAKKALFYVRSSFDLDKSCIYVSSNSNDTAVVSLSSSRSESYRRQADPFHADGGRIKRGTFFNGTIYWYK